MGKGCVLGWRASNEASCRGKSWRSWEMRSRLSLGRGPCCTCRCDADIKEDTRSQDKGSIIVDTVQNIICSSDRCKRTQM
jgi:hypothetical protein